MTKAANGEGSIFKVKKGPHRGRYGAAITVGRDTKGKRVRRQQLFDRRTDADSWLREMKARRDAGQPIAPDNMTVAAYLDYWLSEYVRPRRRLSTAVQAESTIRVWLSPTIGTVQLDKLQPHDVERVLSAMRTKGLAGATQRRAYTVLRAALSQAVKWSLIVRNPAQQVEAPPVQKSHVRALTLEEAKRLLQAVQGDRLEALYCVALSLGLRRGEALGLQWEDVDLERGELRVCRSLQRLQGALVLDTVKTEASVRTIRLPAFAVSQLRAHLDRQRFAGHVPGYVFTSTRGGPLDPRNFNRHMAGVLQEAGITHIRVHDLRHTAASLMRAQGVDIKAISRVLGHSKVGITQDLYSHVFEAEERETAEKMDKLLGGA